MLLSILVAFYDTVSLHQAGHFSECNHTKCKPRRSSKITRTSSSTRTATSNSVDKCVNKKLVKDNANSFYDRVGHSRDLMRCARHPIYTSAFAQPKFIPLHSRLRIHAASFTPYSCCRIHATPILCTYISPKGVCDGRVKNRGWGWNSGQKETLSGQFARKVGRKVLELGKGKSIIQPSTLNPQHGNPQPSTFKSQESQP